VKSVPKRRRPKQLSLWSLILLILFVLVESPLTSAQTNLQAYYDKDYGYEFQYPASWKLQQLPEGDANKDIRLMLQGPDNSSFMVIVDKTNQSLKKTDFEDEFERTRRVDEMMQQTIVQIYQSISQSIKAVDMKVGERRDLSNDAGVKFYIATLNTMKAGKPIIVAGIHTFPFNKDYSINFTMTTFWDPAAKQENEVLMQVFNSFHLIGEPQPPSAEAKPSAVQGDKRESR
jgi:hypothetical protein